ncbi:crotonase/enoyl-CoA hydratase family protein [Marinobacter mobilis]|uniref:Enoyl-CoA hydratase n=2 Tax=Marinobacter mobilis TaxID=488533 RepID=A0A1H2SDX4_9GAMM|nr:crotonase/enoyl-CoA hydratase family protein [Marinobacter mobilis]SDW29775.1 enoyl-CoA hydratase [Marinobacter mobilis]
MSELVTYQLEDGVAILTLNNGKVNAISHEALAALNSALDRAEQDQAVVVMTGQPGIFSGGYDLKEMQKGVAEALALVKVGSEMLRRLSTFPFPVIAACSGHAIAQGAFILLASDYRLGVQGSFKLGLNEVAIGMTMPHILIEVARQRLAPAHFHRAVCTAEIYGPEGAVDAGFLDELTAPEELLSRAKAQAKQFQSLNMTAFRQTKLRVNAGYLALLDECMAKDFAGPGL